MAELYDRSVAKCLDESREYHPVFLSLDPMNNASTLVTALMIDTGLQEFYVDRHATPRSTKGVAGAVFSDLREKTVEYANRRGLDSFQRACVAQCIGYQWYKDTPENSETPGEMENGVGNCRHSTYMAAYFQEAFGIEGRIQDNGIGEMIEGIGHTYSQVTIEGRPFVMNNNLSSDLPGQLCAFRFDRRWEKHRECELFSSSDMKYFKGYSKAWMNNADPVTGAPVPFSGSARSCNSTSITFENARSSGVLIRNPEQSRVGTKKGETPAGSSSSGSR
jgi:hypothetical protein